MSQRATKVGARFRPRAGAWVFSVGCAIALALAASACTVSQSFVSNGLPRLQFAGDSITVQSAGEIDAQFKPSYDVAIDAMVGNDTFLEAPNIKAQAISPPTVELINLGTNDAPRIGTAMIGTYDGQPVTIEPAQTLTDVIGRLDSFAALFPPTTCVIFVTVNTHNPSWAPANAQAIDDHIRTTFSHVVDWDGAWQASYFDTPDDPHPNAAGRAALVALEQQAIDGCHILANGQ